MQHASLSHEAAEEVSVAPVLAFPRSSGVAFDGGFAAGPAAEGALEVRLGKIVAAARGKLAEAIEDAIERSLALVGACPPGIGASVDADAMLSDQLYRARQAGAERLALVLPSLSPIAGPSRALGAEDSETLLFWTRATRERPVTVRLAAEDTALLAHVDPIPLRLALDPSRAASSALRIPGLAKAAAPPAVTPSPFPDPVPGPGPAPGPSPVPNPTPNPDPTPSPNPDPNPTVDDGAWRAPTLALSAARGPQPLAAFERLFVQSYLPLDGMIRDPSQTHDPRAAHARDDFRDNFSRVYAEACLGFAATGKRPKMVLDAPEIAARLARQNSARAWQILMVDAMRYDVGARVRDELGVLLGQKAALANDSILWSALPTTTTQQLMTLVHGASALALEPAKEPEEAAIRGRTAQTIRRVKIGSRDCYRLDLCDARVRDAGERALPMLPSIAVDVAQAIAKHVATLAPRTLLFVFGDHGFTFDRDGNAVSGGSTPEEVLVPAFAYLVGDSH